MRWIVPVALCLIASCERKEKSRAPVSKDVVEEERASDAGAEVWRDPFDGELERLGTIGIRPPISKTIVLTVTRDGTILERGRELSFQDLRSTLRQFSATLRAREKAEGRHPRGFASRGCVLLRADKDLPWQAIQWLMMAVAEAKIYRMFHGVLPEKGFSEGALALFLPTDKGISPMAQEPIEEILLPFAVSYSGPEADSSAAFKPLKQALARAGKIKHRVTIKASHNAPYGFILRLADVLLRAGVKKLDFRGTRIPRRNADLKELVRSMTRPIRKPGIRLGNRELAGSAELPVVSRGRGFAGFVTGNLNDLIEERVDPSEDSVLKDGVVLKEQEERKGAGKERKLAEMAETANEVDELEEEIEPDVPEEEIVEEPIETEEVSDHNEVDTDSEFEETAGADGISDAPFTGPSTNSSIGLGGGAGGGRGGRRNLRAGGGSRLTEDSVGLGLKWLADHQDKDGSWDCDAFPKHDPKDDKCDGSGGAHYDVGVTGLSLLAFLGAGHTDRGSAKQNRYARNVRNGLRFLMASQGSEGCLGGRASQHFMYNHAIATLALCEAYWMTRTPRYKKPAQEALNFIARSRNPYMAWRYEPRGGENDTSVTAWMVAALKSGKFAGLEVDPDAFAGARLWLDKMTGPEFGRVGYNTPGGSPARPPALVDRFPPEKSEAMTAAGILCRIFLGQDPRTSTAIRKGADLCLQQLPAWNPDAGSIDMYYWYYGTLAMYQVGGKHWKAWNAAMQGAIVKHQHPKGSGARTGSWDPIGPWGNDGGRVYSTAIMVLCLEVYYRYDRVFGLK